MNRKSPFTYREIDHLAAHYLNLQLQLDELKRQLLKRCRSHGFRPKDAPKTKMLLGELYEVLASRATRTVVDQRAGVKLEYDFGRRGLRASTFAALFERRVVFDIQPGAEAERVLQELPAWASRAYWRAVQQRQWGTRLTVRKRKLQRSRAAKSQTGEPPDAA